MERRFTKIKQTKAGRITLAWEVENAAGEWDEWSMSCADQPRPELTVAFDNLRPFVEEIVETRLDTARLAVTGVSLSYGGEAETMGAVITCQLRLGTSDAPWCFSTPHKPSAPYSEGGDPNMCLSTECIDALLALEMEAGQYLDGERAQTVIPGMEPPPLTLQEAEAEAAEPN